MRMIESSLDVVYRCIRHAAALQNIKPFFGRFLSCFFLDQAVKFSAMLNSRAVSKETRIKLPLWMPNSVGQYPEKPIVSSSKENIAVERLITTIWHDRC